MITEQEKAFAYACIAQQLEANGFDWEQVPEATESEIQGAMRVYQAQIACYWQLAETHGYSKHIEGRQ